MDYSHFNSIIFDRNTPPDKDAGWGCLLPLLVLGILFMIGTVFKAGFITFYIMSNIPLPFFIHRILWLRNDIRIIRQKGLEKNLSIVFISLAIIFALAIIFYDVNYKDNIYYSLVHSVKYNVNYLLIPPLISLGGIIIGSFVQLYRILFYKPKAGSLLMAYIATDKRYNFDYFYKNYLKANTYFQAMYQYPFKARLIYGAGMPTPDNVGEISSFGVALIMNFIQN